MQNRPQTAVTASRRVMLVLMSLSTLYQYMYCSMLSSALGMLPVLGGAMFMTVRVTATFCHSVLGDGRKYTTRRMRVVFTVLCSLMLICALVLQLLYPGLWAEKAVWILFAVVALLSLRIALARRLVARRMRRTISGRACAICLGLCVAVPLGAMAWILTVNVGAADGWLLWGGFAAGAALEVYSLWRERDLVALEGLPDDIDRETVEHIAHELYSANAYGAFSRLFTLVLLALQLTLVMVCTLIGLTTQALFTCMLLAVGCTVLAQEVSRYCLKKAPQISATHMLLVGLFLWLYGLFLLYRQMDDAPSLLLSYVAVVIVIGGLTISVTALAELERRMGNVAKYQLQNHMHGYTQIRAASTELATLLGQMLALILTTALCMPKGVFLRPSLSELTGAFRPLMVAPPLLLLLAAIVSTLHFPMNNRHFQKLARWLTLEDEGVDNPALREQLNGVVVKRHKNRFGVRLIITLLRPLYYHKVIGKERLNGYEDGSMILICNHGEIYGPVVANLYIPIDFRPWVLDKMMDEQAIVEHMYYGTMERQKWLPERWKRPLIRLITPLFMWIFHSLDAIPVHRGQPKELIQTFRQTLDAMQAGDNILLFPENADEHEEGKSGFVRDGGVGQLYTGFAMIAPMYWAKVHKRAVFVPIYASKKQRTLTIGYGIKYNPENNAGAEKQRIVDELLAAMQRMADEETAKASRKR